MLVTYLSELERWTAQERLASELISLSGQLMRESSTELLLFRKPLRNITSSQALSCHRDARELAGVAVGVEATVALAKAIAQLKVAPSRIDLGRLAQEWEQAKPGFDSVGRFVAERLARHAAPQPEKAAGPKDVVLYGFGRIGRLVARLLIAQAGMGGRLRLRAVVLRRCDAGALLKRADLLRYDSVHGPFAGDIVADAQRGTVTANGQAVQFIESPTPDGIDYARHGISDALVIDCSGVFRDRAGLGRHLLSRGASHALLTAPGQDGVPNIVAGINDVLATQGKGRMFAAASCTTNAIVPVLQAVDERFGIEKGHIETIHSYTNDQNLLDNYHHKYRRGRSAALNLVITETGAGTAVGKVMPQLAGRLTGNAVRVPTPNVSLAILNLALRRPTSKQEINNALRHASLYGPYADQLGYSASNELVSSDLVGDSHAGTVDSPATLVSGDGTSAVLYVWYDNECGYAHQVLRLAEKIAGVGRLEYL